MKVHTVFILNKAGGLIYQNEINSGLNKLTANDYLVLAGTLHGVHAIGSRLTPTIHGKDKALTTEEYNSNQNYSIINTVKAQSPNTNRSGLQSIETDMFNLYIFQTVTGLKFITITSPNGTNPTDPKKGGHSGDLNKNYDIAHEYFRQLYMIYSDYVMKDPFYSLDMPIKSQLFDAKVRELMG
ncbi:uncharacterized protein J8A68_006075 [[Candida] subhashii]|uniref:Trafficking protein particle complex subunit n=1 Tax=[Candida] subhashii TaxID=561895 RepID=A0A8J5Q0K8_9ASCO|nr:uncharacterized protein J8A68_006075 [[Candida] subhashii]KAG7660419.1 hypothetical protein J8A68_006075 [[Candida] subhashii]